jgi:uncharacterized protein YjbI with pentapeptide repeats
MIDASLRSSDLRSANLRNSKINQINFSEATMPDGSIHP